MRAIAAAFPLANDLLPAFLFCSFQSFVDLSDGRHTRLVSAVFDAIESFRTYAGAPCQVGLRQTQLAAGTQDVAGLKRSSKRRIKQACAGQDAACCHNPGNRAYGRHCCRKPKRQNQSHGFCTLDSTSLYLNCWSIGEIHHGVVSFSCSRPKPMRPFGLVSGGGAISWRMAATSWRMVSSWPVTLRSRSSSLAPSSLWASAKCLSLTKARTTNTLTSTVRGELRMVAAIIAP